MPRDLSDVSRQKPTAQGLRDGRFDEKQMSAALITRTDLFETARQRLGADDLSGVRAATLERNGEISLIRDKEAH